MESNEKAKILHHLYFEERSYDWKTIAAMRPHSINHIGD